MRKGMLYPHNVLEGFGNGAILDLRVRMANEFMKSPVLTAMADELTRRLRADSKLTVEKSIATFALDLAEEVTAQAAERGWLCELPEDGELTPALRNQAKVTASYNVLQQIEGNRFAQDQQGKVVPAAPILEPRKH